MFRFFENLVNPYSAYGDRDALPADLLPFMRFMTGPFRRVFVSTVILAILVAIFEVAQIWYMGSTF